MPDPQQSSTTSSGPTTRSASSRQTSEHTGQTTAAQDVRLEALEEQARATNARLEELMRMMASMMRPSQPQEERTASSVGVSEGTTEPNIDAAGSTVEPAEPIAETVGQIDKVEQPEKTKLSGKLDTATLNSCPVADASGMSCAEDWIGQMERVGKRLMLDKESMCMAFCLRATGEVKEFVDGLDDTIKLDWPAL